MKATQLLKQIKYLYFTIALALLIFAVIAFFYISMHGKVYDISINYENNLRSLLLILALSGIPASFIFHSRKVKHIDRELDPRQKLLQYRTGFFIKLITLEGLALLSLLAYITTGQLNDLAIFGIIYLALLVSFPRKANILNELEIDPSDISKQTQQS